MINLVTGLPGSGKTLYTIATVKEKSEKENRPVFYSGINELILPWQQIEADKWHECPAGAIIVIDECQGLFRPRGNGSKVPEYESKLETHRHNGHDLYLITQHPMLISANVRRLTERHSHICRRFGLQRSTILQFESCKDQPLAKVEGAQRLEWSYPKDVFSYYKSAEVHTVKRRIPMMFWMMFLVPVLVGLCIWYFINSHYKDGKVIITPGQKELSTQTSGGAVPGQTRDKTRVMSQKEYLEANTPRIEGLAYTAPIYDEVTKPTRAPVPVGAIVSKKGCKAYTDQGTPLEMPQELCRQIASAGFYRSFDNKQEQAKEQEKN